MAALDVIRGIPLFASLDEGELADVLRIFERASWEPGACLMRQGQPADCALILESGYAEVVTALPGGGTATVASVGPGSVLGEMALLESGTRSATVIARTTVASHAVERDGFRMLLAQRNHAAFEIQSRITLTLCRRLRELNAKILAAETPGSIAPAIAGGGAEEKVSAPHSFDYRAFLPALPVFRRFSPHEIEEFAELAAVAEMARGEALFEQGTVSEVCYLVVRGAVEISNAHNGRRDRIGILGPGRLCGILAMIEGKPHSMSAVARETATLLALDRRTFNRLFLGSDRLAGKFQDAVNQELLQALARTNNHLTRLVSQSRIRGAHARRAEIEELQRALTTQDWRPA